MDDDPAWREFFGFEEPYENQADAVETAIDVGERRGYLAMEGPCGTGKTMAALTAGATLVRRGDYDNVVVVTPVKQQLRQFVADLRTMNAGLDDPLDGVALVGKADLCPYGREGVFPADAGVNDRCEDLREATAGLVEADDSGTRRPAAASAALGGDVAGDEQWWDPDRASDLVRAAREDAESRRTLSGTLSTAGAESPYPARQPSAPEGMVETGTGDAPLYCPFEADWYARDRGSPVDFSAGENRVVTADEYLPASVERGTCPHRVMGVLLGAAEVVVGNYNHLFDPRTRPLVESVLDERTFVVVDEAHRLEGRVRDLLSDRVGRDTLVRARNDCEGLLARANRSRENRRQVRDRLASHDVSLPAVERAGEFYDDVVAWLDERVESALDAEFGRGWRTGDPTELPDVDREIPLRDPETPEPDELTRWAEREGYDSETWRSLDAVGAAVEDAIEAFDDRTPVVAGVGAVMRRWWERDHATNFREVELEASRAEAGATARRWERVYTAGLLLYDCMPAERLRETFAELGGGVLMSATLEPLSVFTEVSGLDGLAGDPARGTAGVDGGDGGDAAGRPVETRTYDLPFPPENRASWLVDAEPYTARNRGEPTAGEGTPTREQYRYILRTVARSPGNVMVAMPSYREAAWAGEYLREAVDRPVLVDESSTNEATERLKRDFFAGGGKVLVTSARGTLTEGVDYDGDKLHACLVVGVPLVSVGSPRVRAVERAYDDAFGAERGFEYALVVPAVRRARQAIGRVVRGPDEVGVRVLADRRYTDRARYGSVHEHLPETERREFVRMTPEFLDDQFERFWADRGSPGG